MSIVIIWTPEMDAELRACSEAGMGVLRAAERIGVDKAVVRRRRDELGLAKPKRGRKKDHRRDALLVDLGGKVPATLLAERFGLSLAGVNSALYRARRLKRGRPA